MTDWNEYPVSQDGNLQALRSLGIRTPSQALNISVMYEGLTKPSSSGYFLVPPDGKYTLRNFSDYLIKCYGMSREGARELTSYLELVHRQKIPASVALSLIVECSIRRERKFYTNEEIKKKLTEKHLKTEELSKKGEAIFKILGLS